MKILIIGGNGTIGRVVAAHFAKNNEVLIAGRSGGDVAVDIAESSSIKTMFEKTGMLDAIICIAGEAKWGDFEHLTEDDFYIGLRSKLMGQINLTRIGQYFLKPQGSITLSTGILADNPVVKTTSAAVVNGGLHSFVKSVALEIGNGIRVNAVSLGVVEDAYEKYKDYFPGHKPISMEKVINGYVESVNGEISGQVIRIYE